MRVTISIDGATIFDLPLSDQSTCQEPSQPPTSVSAGAERNADGMLSASGGSEPRPEGRPQGADASSRVTVDRQTLRDLAHSLAVLTGDRMSHDSCCAIVNVGNVLLELAQER